MTLSPGATLGPYAIRAELGHGGMGVVYTAHDPRLKRQVAIKLLTADLTRDETAKQRFLQEAQAASALDHPNICTIYEINETDDGQLYLVMAYYEGETLKQRIERGPLALDDAIEIAMQVGHGLAEAHGAGIVHRDIKPANLLIAKGGVVKILDFGLAKLAGAEGVTQTGTTVGTVAYMSPEQARGQEVDHRTDIWSLGVVLYEILTGQQPFQGDNLLAISNAILESEPVSLTRLRAGTSAALARVVTRSLANSRDGRYQSVGDLLDELRNATAAAAQATSQPEVPSIAVLPFADMSPEKDQDYFCEGLAEELIDALARLEGLRVVARTSAFQFRGKGHDLREVGEKLRVKTVLEGSVRKAGNRLRINAQLINAEDGYHLWSERYDREMDDVFAVQEDIAQAVVKKLQAVILVERAETVIQRGTDNLDAYHWFLKGRHAVLKLTSEGYTKAIDCYRHALTAQPDYADPLAGIALVYEAQAIMGWTAPHESMPRAREAALEAVTHDEASSHGFLALALVLHWYDWDWAGAEREYRRAIELNAGLPFPYTGLAEFLAQMGRSVEAIAHAKTAIGLDPLDFHAQRMLATVFAYAGRFDEAQDQARTVLDIEPSYVPAYWALALARDAQRQYDEALTACTRGLAYAKDDTVLLAESARALAKLGRGDEAERVLDRLLNRRRNEYFSAVLIAGVYDGLGREDETFEWLERACEDRDGLAGC